jgi:hypothetical protein
MTQGDDSYARRLENDRKLAEWKQRKKAEAEEKEREQKRNALQRYLSERGRQWEDHTGTPPSTRLFELWTEEYMNTVQAESELEREARINESIESNYPY